MKRLILISTILLFGIQAHAATYTVTPTMTPEAAWTMLEAAGTGDTVLIAPGTYLFRVDLENDGVTVKAQNPADRPLFDYTGNVIAQVPGSIPATNWKSSYAWIVQGDNVTVDGIRIKGSKMPTESARGMYVGPDGIVSEPATPGSMPTGVILRNVEIADNDNGLDSASINLLVEDSVIGSNGVLNKIAGINNVYLQGGSATFVRTKFENALSGQHVNSRAQYAEFIDCDFGVMGSFPVLMNTPKATMTNGTPYTQTFIVRDSRMSGERQNGLGLSKAFAMDNGSNYAGLTQKLELYNNTYTGVPGNTGVIVAMYRKSGHYGFYVTSEGNTYANYQEFFRVGAGEDINSAIYHINVTDVSDGSLPGSTTPPPPPPVNGITFNMSWDQADTANLKGWNVWGTTTEGAWGAAQFIPFVEGMTFSYQMDLPQSETYYFKIRPLNTLNQEGEGGETTVTPEPVPLPGPTTNFNVIIVP